MRTLLAVDDGLANGNFNAADILFLAATILAVLAAIAAFPPREGGPGWPMARWIGVLMGLALACAAFGLFLL